MSRDWLRDCCRLVVMIEIMDMKVFRFSTERFEVWAGPYVVDCGSGE